MYGDTLPLSLHGFQGRVIRAALLVPGILVFAFALVAPSLRDHDGWLTPIAWTLAVGGVSLSLLGVAWRTCWQRCAALLSLALVGQALALQLLDVGPSIRLQHYYPWSDLMTSFRGLFLVGLLGQTLIAVGLARVQWPSLHNWVVRCWGIRLIIFLGFATYVAATVSRDPLRYAGELVLAGWVLLVNVLGVAACAAAVPSDAVTGAAGWLERQFNIGREEGTRPPRWDRLVPWIAAGWVIVVSSLLSWFALDRIPHIPDSVAYLFQAKYFALGRLYLPAPPDAAAFVVPHTINDGSKWYSIFPPGWPAVLAIGARLGSPWLVNPVLAGLTVLLVHILISELYTRRMAHATVGLLAVSPMFLFMSASFMAHPLSLVCSLTAWIGVHKARIHAKALWAGIAGLGLGVLVLIRPFEGVLIGIATGLWALGAGAKRLALPALLALGLASIAVGGLLFPYNRSLTGQATYDPITKYFDERYYPGSNRLGFGPDVGNVGWIGLDPLPGHGPVDVLVNANENFYMLNFDLFGWSFGSLWFAVLLLLWGRWTRADWLLVTVVLLVIGGLSLYWFSGGPDFGARYWYQILVPVTVLTVRGVSTAWEHLCQVGATKLVRHRLWIFIGIASLVGFINVVPWRALDKYHHYRGMRPDIRGLSREYAFGPSLVLIRSKDNQPFPEYSSASIFNPPSLDEPGTIYARDLGPAHTALLREHFADRPAWVIASPSLTGAGMQIVAGPLPPHRRVR